MSTVVLSCLVPLDTVSSYFCVSIGDVLPGVEVFHKNFAYSSLLTRRLIIKTRAPRGTDRSPEYNEHFCYKLDSRVKNLTTEWKEKQQHFITHASRSLL